MKLILLFIILYINYISTDQIGHIKTSESHNGNKSLEAKVRNIKKLVANATDSDTKPKSKTKNLTKWSKWSRCKNCKKTRRRKCISSKCHFSTFFEQRPCGTKRCKRRIKRRDKITHIIHSYNSTNLQLRNIFPNQDDYWNSNYRPDYPTYNSNPNNYNPGVIPIQNPYEPPKENYNPHFHNTHDVNLPLVRRYNQNSPNSNKLEYSVVWGQWSKCSRDCTTKRFKICYGRGCNGKAKTIQTAFCYWEGSNCETEVKKILNTYDKKVPKKKKKKPCGMLWNNSTYSISNNMLKIIGGFETKHTKWPWHVAIMNKYKEVFCGGTLIAPKWILTAAHCIRPVLYASLNEFDITYEDGSELQYRITKVYIHPNFDQYTVDNDIALLKLPKPVSIPFICLPKKDPAVGTLCTVMGWGKKRPSDKIGSKTLREAQMPVVSQRACSKSYNRYILTENMFCAGYKNGKIDTCSGDSGGGLFCPPSGPRGWEIQGITSFGEGCGKRGKYGIYVVVKNYIEWLRDIMKRY